jgi:hypothetical protein
VICRCPKSDFLRLMTKNNRCSVLDSMSKLSKTIGKDGLFAWRDPAGLAQ